MTNQYNEDFYDEFPKGGKGKNCSVINDYANIEKSNNPKKTSSKNSKINVVISKKLHANKKYNSKLRNTENKEFYAVNYEEDKKLSEQFGLGF